MTRRVREIACGLLLLALPGCRAVLGIHELDDIEDAGSVLQPDSGDARTSDSARADADASVDGDARGLDETDASTGDVGPDACPACGCDVDLSSDLKNCGACGHDCTAGRHVGTTDGIQCLAGKCVLPPSACAMGYGNCNDDADDGCETDLTKPEHCVSCMNVCEAATPLCTAGGCKASCPAETPVQCGQSCIDTASDPKHCSDCTTECTQPTTGGNATCKRGVCGVECLAGYHLCNGKDCARDDDATRCGATCTACPAPEHGKATCSTTGCGIACDANYKACGNACLDTVNDVKNCGDCGHDCTALAHIASTTGIQCVRGVCVVPSTACAPGWGHCSTRADDGCETDLASPQHCRDCTTVCPAGNPLCTASGCTNACQSNAPTLCGSSCVDLTSDPKHCGDCSKACQQPTSGGNTTCDQSKCVLHCVTGFHACGEFDCGSNTDALRCEGPNCHACPGSATGDPQCAANACTLSCRPGFHLCSGACVSDTDAMNCGSGCMRCAGPTSGPGSAQCSNGGCTIACNQGYHACGTTCMSNTDAMHCTDACIVCPGPANGTAGGSGVCAGGQCDIQCGANYYRCGNDCLPNGSCTPGGNACHTGRAACSGGAPSCQDTGNEGDGKNCGGTNQCHGGVCTCTGVGLGCICSTNGATVCNGTAQKLTLLCSNGIWQDHGTCSNGQNCDQTNGTCAAIIPQCTGHAGGFTYCEGQDVLRTCGADLVTATTMTCPGVCSAGQCVAPRCGDGKVQAGEECDDGNQTPVDGCEPSCVRSGVLALALGQVHSCALLRDGYVRCWGDNTSGQLGLGHANFQADRLPYLVTNALGQTGPVDLGGPAKAIAAGGNHTCALLNDNSIRCWGGNTQGELGLGDANPRMTSTPRTLGAINVGSTALAISVGEFTSCALLQGGTVKCWGDNSFGLLGLGSTTQVSRTQTPNQFGPVSLGTTALAVAAGTENSCALLQGGSVRCWGYGGLGANGLGNLNDVGDNEAPSTVGPLALPASRTAASISAGGDYACARLDNGQVECWGDNLSGQLGLGHTLTIGDNEQATSGILSTGVSGVTNLVTGRVHACAMFANGGGLRCWGLNLSGQLGYQDTNPRGKDTASTPNLLQAVTFGGPSATAFFLGGAHTCVLLSDGKVRCWGANGSGQLGLGYISSAPKPYVGGDPAQTPDHEQLLTVRLWP